MTTRRERKLLQALDRIRQIHQVLSEDTLLGLRLLKEYVDGVEADTFDVWTCAYWTKLSIRGFLGQVDGVSYAMRAGTAEVARDLALAFSEEDLLRLEEKRKRSDGEVVPKLLAPDESLKLAWRFFPRLFNVEFQGDTFGPGWQAFKVLKRARNAFTHPDTIDDLASRAGLPRIQPCVVWFTSEMARLFGELGVPAEAKKHFQRPDVEKLKGLALESPTFSDSDHALIGSSAGMSMAYFRHGVIGMIREVGWASDLVWRRESEDGPLPYGKQFGIRNFIRTVDSVLQGTASFMKRFLEDAAARSDLNLDPSERHLLEEKGGTLDDYIAMLNLWSQKVGTGKQVREKGEEYAAFRRMLSRRDRVVHPKQPADLVFSSDFLQTIIAASQWYWESTGVTIIDEEWRPSSLAKKPLPEI